MAKGNVKNPIGVALDFCDKVTKGELFVAAAPENAEAIKQAKKIEQEQKIQGIVNRNKEKIRADLEAKGFVHFHGFGNFTRDMLKPYLQ
jgi:nucleoid DNA-binding protein